MRGSKSSPDRVKTEDREGLGQQMVRQQTEYADLLHEDLKIKKLIKDRFYQAGVSRIEIERR